MGKLPNDQMAKLPNEGSDAMKTTAAQPETAAQGGGKSGAMSPTLRAHGMKMIETGLDVLGLDGDDVFGHWAKMPQQRLFWAWWLEQGEMPSLACRLMAEPEMQVRVVLRGLDLPENDDACRDFVDHYCTMVHNGVRPVAASNPLFLRGGNMDCCRMVEAALKRGFCLKVIERCVGTLAARAYTLLQHEGRRMRSQLVTITEVIDAVCEVMTVEPDEMFGDGRHSKVVLARSMVGIVGYELCDVSFPDLALALRNNSRAHATIQEGRTRVLVRAAKGEKTLVRGEWVPMLLVIEMIRKRAVEIRDTRVSGKSFGEMRFGGAADRQRGEPADGRGAGAGGVAAWAG